MSRLPRSPRPSFSALGIVWWVVSERETLRVCVVIIHVGIEEEKLELGVMAEQQKLKHWVKGEDKAGGVGVEGGLAWRQEKMGRVLSRLENGRPATNP